MGTRGNVTVLFLSHIDVLCMIPVVRWRRHLPLAARLTAGLVLGFQSIVAHFIKHYRHFMARTFKTIAFAASATDEAQAAEAELIALYGQEDPAEADVIVALGGDGFMLQTLHKTMNSGKLIYGMNRGSIGFLMNRYSTENLHKRLADAVENTFRPLEMQTVDADGNSFKALAINEVYLFRQSYQAAKLRVVVDDRVRLEELVCDGVLLSTSTLR